MKSARNYESKNVLTPPARRRGGDACGVLLARRIEPALRLFIQVERSTGAPAQWHKSSSTSYVGVPLLRPELQEMVPNVARPRRASAAARPMTLRVLAAAGTPRRAAQVVHLTRAAAHSMPCRTSIGSHRSGSQLRRGGCADAGGGGVGGVGSRGGSRPKGVVGL